MGLPGYEKGKVWFCRDTDLKRWLLDHRFAVPEELSRIDAQSQTALSGFADALKRGGIHYNLPFKNKYLALAAAVNLLKLPSNLSQETLLSRLLEREEMASTGIGDGIAIPHPREPLAQLAKPVAALCFLAQPLNFNALDGKPIHALFLLISPTSKHHLYILARLFFLLRKPGFRALIVPQSPVELIFKEIANVEHKLHKSD